MRTGLALSGGGFRATLFSLGSLIRLNELGLLRKIDTITSVSGGAITAGYLAYKWSVLKFDSSGKATNFDNEVVYPLIEFCNQTIDYPSVFKGLLSVRSTIGDVISQKYDQHLFNHVLLKEISEDNDPPEFIFYGTNYDTGVSVQITKEYLRDYRIGKATNHNISLSQAVGISSAFPPFFSPIELDGSMWKWEPTKYSDLFEELSIREKLILCDGGLYDNLGIEKLWKTGVYQTYHTVFVCDSGAPLDTPYRYSPSVFGKVLQFLKWRKNWGAQFMRMSDIMINQQRALRKRQLIANYLPPKSSENSNENSQKGSYYGAYWGIDTNIEEYPGITPLVSYGDFDEMANLPTQFRPFSIKDQKALINWSYALSDAALCSRYDLNLPSATDLPKIIIN